MIKCKKPTGPEMGTNGKMRKPVIALKWIKSQTGGGAKVKPLVPFSILIDFAPLPVLPF